LPGASDGNGTENGNNMPPDVNGITGEESKKEEAPGGESPDIDAWGKDI